MFEINGHWFLNSKDYSEIVVDMFGFEVAGLFSNNYMWNETEIQKLTYVSKDISIL